MFYIDVIGIPVAVGIIFRLLFIKKEKGFYATLSAFFVAIAFSAYAVYLYTVGHSGGNEGPGLLALATVMAFLGTAITEGLRWIYMRCN